MRDKPQQASTGSAEPVISLRDVSFSYDGMRVIENADVTVRDREWACVVGPNGGGKTTLLKLVLGLVQPEAGEVRVFGGSPERARLRVGYMPQRVQHDPQFPVTVTDVVLMGRLGRRLGGPYSKADREAAQVALEEVALAELAKRPFSALSGGQQQRVLIARALACEPDLLLLDEPTANIDALVETKLFEILQALNARMTILMASHDLGFVSSLADSVICVNRRVIIHPTSEITGEIIRDIYGGDLRLVRHDHRCAEKGHSAEGEAHG